MVGILMADQEAFQEEREGEADEVKKEADN